MLQRADTIILMLLQIILEVSEIRALSEMQAEHDLHSCTLEL